MGRAGAWAKGVVGKTEMGMSWVTVVTGACGAMAVVGAVAATCMVVWSAVGRPVPVQKLEACKK